MVECWRLPPRDAHKASANRSSNIPDSIGPWRPRLQDKATHGRCRTAPGVAGDFCGCRFSLSERLLQTLTGKGLADRSTAAETVRDHFRTLRRFAVTPSMRSEATPSAGTLRYTRQSVCIRHGIPVADRHPHRAGQLVGKTIEGERRVVALSIGAWRSPQGAAIEAYRCAGKAPAQAERRRCPRAFGRSSRRRRPRP